MCTSLTNLIDFVLLLLLLLLLLLFVQDLSENHLLLMGASCLNIIYLFVHTSEISISTRTYAGAVFFLNFRCHLGYSESDWLHLFVRWQEILPFLLCLCLRCPGSHWVLFIQLCKINTRFFEGWLVCWTVLLEVVECSLWSLEITCCQQSDGH